MDERPFDDALEGSFNQKTARRVRGLEHIANDLFHLVHGSLNWIAQTNNSPWNLDVAPVSSRRFEKQF